MVRPVLSQYLVDELREKPELPRFRLTPATQAAIIADYLSFAEFVTDVPESGIQSRDPKDTPILDLALVVGVDALISGDRDLHPEQGARAHREKGRMGDKRPS